MFQNIVQAVRQHAAERPETPLFTFLQNGDDDAVVHTAGTLTAEASTVAAALLRRGLRGKRVMIALPPGLEYISALLGCFYAGAIAVPAFPAHRENEWPRVRGILKDCDGRVAIVKAARSASADAWGGIELLDIDELLAGPANGFEPSSPESDDVAWLQYTSGSTGSPKGVRVTHGNLAHNTQRIYDLMGKKPYRGVIWLPPYHDMGLVGGILLTIFTGHHVTLFSPLHFLQRPARWLRAISNSKATSSAAPDFAYRFCAERVSPDELHGLDLSSWEYAFSGAEPIRSKTLDLFGERFAPYGFRKEAFLPSYGLAECTLLVTAKRPTEKLRSMSFRRKALEAGRAEACDSSNPDAQSFVSSGPPAEGMTVKIVDLDSEREVPAGRVGEIWVHGASVAAGYWNASAETDPFNHALRSDADDRRYLRTGDIGFLHEGELFVSGRTENHNVIQRRNVAAEGLEEDATEGH